MVGARCARNRGCLVLRHFDPPDMAPRMHSSAWFDLRRAHRAFSQGLHSSGNESTTHSHTGGDPSAIIVICIHAVECDAVDNNGVRRAASRSQLCESSINPCDCHGIHGQWLHCDRCIHPSVGPIVERIRSSAKGRAKMYSCSPM